MPSENKASSYDCLVCTFPLDAHQPDPTLLGSPPLVCPPECDECYGTGQVQLHGYGIDPDTDDCDNCGGKGYL